MYTTATIKDLNGVERNDYGIIQRLVVNLTGDAQEVQIETYYEVAATTTALDVREWRDEQIDNANNNAAFSALPAIQPGAVIPPAPASSEALDVWQEKVGRLQRMQGLYVALDAHHSAATDAQFTALGAEMTALANDVLTTAPPGWPVEL